MYKCWFVFAGKICESEAKLKEGKNTHSYKILTARVAVNKLVPYHSIYVYQSIAMI